MNSMKNMFRISAFIFVAAFFSVLVTSCDKDNDPVVAQISSVNPAKEYPRGTVTLEGRNFNQVQYVFLGTRAVDYTTNGTTLSFAIPHGTVAGVTDITLILLGGIREKVSIEVLPSADPIFASLSKRAARAGEDVTIIGGSLNDAKSVTVGGIEAKIKSSSANSLTFTVPSGVPDKRGKIKVVTRSGENMTASNFYVGTEVLITDFDGGGIGGWGGAYGPSTDMEKSGVKSSNPAPIDKNFFKLAVGSASGWGGGTQIDKPFNLTETNRDNVLFVIDVNTNGTNMNYRFNLGDGSNTWGLYPKATQGWETLEIPLASFGTEYGGSPNQDQPGKRIDPTKLKTIKVQIGSKNVGAEVNFDNVRFIELDN